MPTVPNIPGALAANALPPADPQNFLLAAADLHEQGQLSAPVPSGHPLQTGKKISKRHKLEVVK